MNNMIKNTCLLALSLSLVACVSSPSKSGGQKTAADMGKEPSWVINPPDRTGHVYGVGSAEYYVDPANGLKLAKDKARLDLVSKMKVTVSGSFNQEINEIRATGKETQLIKSVKQSVQSKVPAVELEEVQIEESWVNRSKKLAYAMAYLDRKKAESRIRQKISELDLELGQLAKTPEKGSTLEQLREVLPALEIFLRRDYLSQQAQMVSVSGRKPTPEADIRNLEKRIYKLLDKLIVAVKAENGGAREIQTGIVENLTKAGMRISDQSGADITIAYAVTLRPVEKAGTHYVFANGRVTLTDPQGRVLSEFSREAKGVSSYKDLAQAKAVKNMAKVLGLELGSTLVDKIN